MKRFRYLLITAIFVYCLSVAVSAEQKTTDAEQLNSVLNVRDAAEYTYPTKFGDVQFVRADGNPGEPGDNRWSLIPFPDLSLPMLPLPD
ncbi:hypothetical protein GTP45_27030 [Pseudoduganella sp. FT55W]|uniref:Uncharacterized protein n=1 Tax=Duganella rivi TaxID=2666083 RepID=A0A7X4KEI3_9BURK|nr:hypothetical protein [Duganella rivi]MYM70434.1 hypothetical protein [Duganella rivi]